ncbi:40S ribosomal protein S20-like [Ctenocephalides felis]|uniref:40S ribosomal protein S20-like n=1 Tax=Ctenocephalides felis TaxID=7515 RepID=UPI000E6E2691|nr:40S ribosomal protein S20-like [Ctenocephalides felis]
MESRSWDLGPRTKNQQLRCLRSIASVLTDLINGAKKQKLRVKGPVRMPTKILRITTCKTHCGVSVIDLHSPSEIVKQITSISIEPGVDLL